MGWYSVNRNLQRSFPLRREVPPTRAQLLAYVGDTPRRHLILLESTSRAVRRYVIKRDDRRWVDVGRLDGEWPLPKLGVEPEVEGLAEGELALAPPNHDPIRMRVPADGPIRVSHELGWAPYANQLTIWLPWPDEAVARVDYAPSPSSTDGWFDILQRALGAVNDVNRLVGPAQPLFLPDVAGRSLIYDEVWFQAYPAGNLRRLISTYGFAHDGAPVCRVATRPGGDVHLLVWVRSGRWLAPARSEVDGMFRFDLPILRACARPDDLEATVWECIARWSEGDGGVVGVAEDGRVEEVVSAVSGPADGTILTEEERDAIGRLPRSFLVRPLGSRWFVLEIRWDPQVVAGVDDALGDVALVLDQLRQNREAHAELIDAIPEVRLSETEPGPIQIVAGDLQDAGDLLERVGRPLFGLAADPEDAAWFAREVSRNPLEPGRITTLLEAVELSADQLLAGNRGRRWLAVAVAEHVVAAVSADPHATVDGQREVEVFAAAITAFLRSAAEHEQVHFQIASRLLNLTHEWVQRREARPWEARASLRWHHYPPGEQRRLAELIALAPWLALWCDVPSLDPHFPAVLSPGQFVEVLALARPRCRYRPGANARNAGLYLVGLDPNFREKVTSRYRVEGCDGAFDGPEGAEELDRLALALEHLYRDPLTAARYLQTVQLPGALLEAAQAGIGRAGAEHQGSIDDLRVIADRPTSTGPTTLLIANTGADTTVHVRFDGIEHRLWQFAPEVEHATGYVWGPLHADPQLEIDASGTSLQAEVPVRGPVEHLRTSAVTDELDPGLFEGRTRSLRFLTAQMGGDLLERVPVVIFGTRRAGKSTLANRASALGVELGLAAAGITVRIDRLMARMIQQPDQASAILARQIRRQLKGRATADAAGLRAGLSDRLDDLDADDVLDFLDDLDGFLDGGLPVNLVLDEFDSLLVAEPPEIRHLAQALGVRTWRNIFAMATAQRFYRREVELKQWSALECAPDLLWVDGLHYFCPSVFPGPDASNGSITVVNRPSIGPRTFDWLTKRIGMRAYLWGALRQLMEQEMRQDPDRPSFFEQGQLDRLIDHLLETDSFLRSPTRESGNLSMQDRLVADVFSDHEKRILALFGGDRAGVPVSVAERVGGPEAVKSLVDRCHAVIEYDQVRMAVPVFQDLIRRCPEEFRPYLDPDDPDPLRSRTRRGKRGGSGTRTLLTDSEA